MPDFNRRIVDLEAEVKELERELLTTKSKSDEALSVAYRALHAVETGYEGNP